jgi:hypothetical protein
MLDDLEELLHMRGEGSSVVRSGSLEEQFWFGKGRCNQIASMNEYLLPTDSKYI